MHIHVSNAWCAAKRLSLKDQGTEVGHAFVVVMKDDNHARPFAALEDVWVDAGRRGEGLGEKLVEGAVKVAKTFDCHKIVLTSRDGRAKLHAWYEGLGFTKHGSSFRMDL